MRTTFRSAIVAVGCALAVSAAQTGMAQADSVLTINPDGSVAQVESPQGEATFQGDASLYQGDASALQGNSAWANTPVAGANSTMSWGTQSWGTQGRNRSQGWSANPGWGATQGWNGTQAAGVRSRPHQSRDTRRSGDSFQQPGFTAQGDISAQRKVIVRPGRGDRDIIIDGDNNKIVIRPGRGAYYPPYNWGGYPVYGYPVYGYPRYGYPVYGYPVYGYPQYGYPGWGLYPYYPSRPNGGIVRTPYLPIFGGTYGSLFPDSGGGINITLGADRGRVRSRGERVVTSDTRGSNLTPSPFIMPNSNTSSIGGFVMPSQGSRQVIQRSSGSGRASRR